jgi:hypothetical protein
MGKDRTGQNQVKHMAPGHDENLFMKKASSI